MTEELRCKATNRDGDPCGVLPHLVDPESGLCYAHQPGVREQLIEAGKKGGAATAKKWKRKGLAEEELPELRTPHDAAARLDLIARAVGTSRLGHNEGRTMVSAVQQWLKAHEAGALEDKVQELRRQLREAKGEGAKLERVK